MIVRSARREWKGPLVRIGHNGAMTEMDRNRRRADRDRLRLSPPNAGVVLYRHRATGRLVVTGVPNLKAAQNRFDFAVSMRSASALSDPALMDDARTHGFDGLGFDVLEEVEVDPTATTRQIQADLDTLVELWRERLARPQAQPGAPPAAAADADGG